MIAPKAGLTAPTKKVDIRSKVTIIAGFFMKAQGNKNKAAPPCAIMYVIFRPISSANFPPRKEDGITIIEAMVTIIPDIAKERPILAVR